MSYCYTFWQGRYKIYCQVKIKSEQIICTECKKTSLSASKCTERCILNHKMITLLEQDGNGNRMEIEELEGEIPLFAACISIFFTF